jgi:hypothetical protein
MSATTWAQTPYKTMRRHPQSPSKPITNIALSRAQASGESFVNWRLRRGKGEAATTTRRFWITGGPLEPPHTDMRKKTRPTTTTSLCGAIASHRDHRVRMPRAATFIFYKNSMYSVPPQPLAISSEPSTVTLAPPCRSTTAPLYHYNLLCLLWQYTMIVEVLVIN